MSYLLDTDVVSSLRRKKASTLPAFRWRDSVGQVPCYISVITVLELEYGAALATRNNYEFSLILRQWIDEQVMVEFAGAILPVGVEVARVFAQLQAIQSRGVNDCLIASTALVHDMTLVSRNVRDHAPTGVRFLDPWSD